MRIDGGGGEIRTHERITPSPVFKTGAFNRSATPPLDSQHYAIRSALEQTENTFIREESRRAALDFRSGIRGAEGKKCSERLQEFLAVATRLFGQFALM